MRTTQYIGLNQDALDFVEKNKIEEPEAILLCQGMFDEDVPGRQWRLKPPKGPNAAFIAKEVMQITPWSSGPMIFTSLEMILVKEEGDKVGMGTAFDWVWNPELEGEYDPVKGQYNV